MKTKTMFLMLGVIEFIVAFLLTFFYESTLDYLFVLVAYAHGVIFSGAAFGLLIYETIEKKRGEDGTKRS